MVIKTSVLKVVDLWDMVKSVLLEYKPAAVPEDHIGFHNLLWALQSNRAQLWLWLPDYPEGETIGGWSITSVQVNIFGVKELVVHFIYTYINGPPEVAKETVEKFSMYAKKMGCKRLVGYTKSEQFAKVMAGTTQMQTIGYIVGRDI